MVTERKPAALAAAFLFQRGYLEVEDLRTRVDMLERALRDLADRLGESVDLEPADAQDDQ